MHFTHKYQGFTLPEMMIGLAIIIILTAAGIPGYMNYARNGSRDNTSRDLYTDMYFARSEAIKRKASIYICRSGDATASDPTCGGSTKDWSQGWLVYVDESGGTTGAYDDGTDTLLKVGYPANNRIHVKSNANADKQIAFLSDGSLNTIYAPAEFAICDDRDNDGNDDKAYGQLITVAPMGRPEITKKPASCTP